MRGRPPRDVLLLLLGAAALYIRSGCWSGSASGRCWSTRSAPWSTYLVADGPRLRRSVCSVLPPGRQEVALRIWELAIDSNGGDVYSRALSPRITARTMALHPAVAFGAVIAGGAIMGPIGALLALPAAASVQALVSSYLPATR